jgi:hypothetical protein
MDAKALIASIAADDYPTDPVDDMITACYRELGHVDPTLCETLVEGLRSGVLVRTPEGWYVAPDAG